MIITIIALMLAASLVACMKPGKEDGIVNYDYAD
jgi:hypothetical protein